MTLRDVKRIVEEEGYSCCINPVHMHADVRSDDMDESSVAYLDVNEDGHVRHDGIAQEGVVAKNEEELRAWCENPWGN